MAMFVLSLGIKGIYSEGIPEVLSSEGIAVTLGVDGKIITGFLIPLTDFMAEQINILGLNGKRIAEDRLNHIRNDPDTPPYDPDKEIVVPDYIQLKEARVLENNTFYKVGYIEILTASISWSTFGLMTFEQYT